MVKNASGQKIGHLIHLWMKKKMVYRKSIGVGDSEASGWGGGAFYPHLEKLRKIYNYSGIQFVTFGRNFW